jgi:hypothetical protein
MIIELMSNNIENLQSLIKDYIYFEKNKEFKDENDFNNQIKNVLLTRDNNAYYYIDDNDLVSGLIICKRKRNTHLTGFISFLYIENAYNNENKKYLRNIIEKNLIEKAIIQLKQNCDFIEIKKRLNNLSTELLLSQGFSKIPRANMNISKEDILKIPNIKENPNYLIIPFENHWIKKCAQLIVETNKEEIDSQIFPEFTNINSAKKMIKEFINNKYGNFENKYSSLLAKEGILIGYCFITIFDKMSGFILDIGITPKFRPRCKSGRISGDFTK